MNHLKVSLISTGLCYYLFKSLKHKKRHIFKVNAQPYESDATFNLWEPVNKPPYTSTPIKQYEIKSNQSITDKDKCFSPTVASLKGSTFFACCDNETGIPYWTLEHVTKDVFVKLDTFEQSEMSFLKACSSEPSFHIGEVPDVDTYCRFKFNPCVFQLTVPTGHRRVMPSVDVWTDFYNHVKVLAQRYQHIYVCSGPVYIKSSGGVKKAVSHFFKVILCRNMDGSSKFECYLFDNADMCCLLSEFVVSIKEVEEMVGFRIFPDASLFSGITELICPGCLLL